jgi:hypothetical protein
VTNAETWSKNNDAYLAEVLSWLKSRLHKLGAASGESIRPLVLPAEPAEPPKPPKPRRWLRRLFCGNPAPTPPPGATTPQEPGGSQPGNNQQVTGSGASLPSSFMDPPPAANTLQRLLGLSNFELAILLLCVALELDTSMADLCAQAQGKARAYPTFALAMALFDDPAWEALSPERPLRYWRLIEVTQSPSQALTTSPLRADERIVNYIKGLNYLDDRLEHFLSALPIADLATGALAPSLQEQSDGITARLQASLRTKSGSLPLVQLIGPGLAAKERVAAEAGRQLGLRLYRLPATALPAQPSELDNWIRLWQRETALLPVGLVLDAGESQGREAGDGVIQSVTYFLGNLKSLVFLTCREPWSQARGDTLIFEIEKPTPGEQATAWVQALGPEAKDTAARLAGHFNLDVMEIRSIAARQQALGQVELAQLWEACLRHCRPGLDILAQRIVPHSSWNDIVLPDATAQLLQEIADQVEQRSRVYDTWGFREKMSRGLGISVLFFGESGTGKTMAAEVIAKQLQLDLYRIDLSAVVSKYIGETEKNLRRLFDAAENGGGILFFDEADSIFAKRSEVKDSHDRYANLEISYLLQRMEAYHGLAILATNMKSALDQAFMRRLRFIVKFPVPGPDDRKLIWMKIFPPETPLEKDDPQERIDYDRLAKVNLTGGGINNAALNAAFLAAKAGSKVTMSLLIKAIHTELKKNERPVQPI